MTAGGNHTIIPATEATSPFTARPNTGLWYHALVGKGEGRSDERQATMSHTDYECTLLDGSPATAGHRHTQSGLCHRGRRGHGRTSADEAGAVTTSSSYRPIWHYGHARRRLTGSREGPYLLLQRSRIKEVN
ncbi:MAG: hypothetical protein MZV63_11565 [Marinilabiliales bacterium]|nr:hypothetical protein [Marinilabiliales bacterium]